VGQKRGHFVLRLKNLEVLTTSIWNLAQIKVISFLTIPLYLLETTLENNEIMESLFVYIRQVAVYDWQLRVLAGALAHPVSIFLSFFIFVFFLFLFIFFVSISNGLGLLNISIYLSWPITIFGPPCRDVGRSVTAFQTGTDAKCFTLKNIFVYI